jgi:hypothetical protein
VQILIGPEQREFVVSKERLSASSDVFRNHLEEPTPSPDGLTLEPTNSLWIESECPVMFEFFVTWLHEPESFRRHLDEAINTAAKRNDASSQRLHWSLVRLHLFAVQIALPELQDAAMDAIQDLYLGCNWDVTVGFVRYLYGMCDARTSTRLRRWTVAMVSWSVAGGAPSGGAGGGCGDDDDFCSDPTRFDCLFGRYPEFEADYAVHARMMKSSKIDMRIKNPQLRIPANKLRSDERHFGFRQCSFHSHRATVGERKCPHSIKPISRPPPPPPADIQRPSIADVWLEDAIKSPVPDPLFTQDIPPQLRRAMSKMDTKRQRRQGIC